MTLQDIMELRNLVSIAHHVPGRIRLKLDPGILQHPAAKHLSSLSSAKPEVGLKDARLNILARSLVLEYDTSRISPDEFETFLNGKDIPKAEQAALKTAALLGLPLQT